MREAERAVADGQCFDLNRAVAPIDHDRVLVAHVGIREVARERDRLVLEDHRLVNRQGRDLRRVVDGGDVDDKGLHGAFVVTAVERAAVVGQLEADRGAAVGVGRQRVGQLATGIDGRPGGEQTWIAVAVDHEAQRLTGLIGRSGRETRRPGGDDMRAAVFQHVLIRPLAERRFVVDGIHRDGEELCCCCDGRAASCGVVGQRNSQRGNTMGVGCRCISQRAIGGDERRR